MSCVFFFKQKTAYEMRISDWSSDVCSSDLVTDIVLNVKQIALKMEGEGPKRLQLSATGPGPVKAGDIAVSGDIDVLNHDLIICHLAEGPTLNMELTADTGKGYVPGTATRPAAAPIGRLTGAAPSVHARTHRSWPHPKPPRPVPRSEHLG